VLCPSNNEGGFIASGASASMDGYVTGNHNSGDFWIIRSDSTGSLQWDNDESEPSFWIYLVKIKCNKFLKL
jgi:hypothetical protein